MQPGHGSPRLVSSTLVDRFITDVCRRGKHQTVDGAKRVCTQSDEVPLQQKRHSGGKRQKKRPKLSPNMGNVKGPPTPLWDKQLLFCKVLNTLFKTQPNITYSIKSTCKITQISP